MAATASPKEAIRTVPALGCSKSSCSDSDSSLRFQNDEQKRATWFPPETEKSELHENFRVLRESFILHLGYPPPEMA